jgi:hypothetical protein
MMGKIIDIIESTRMHKGKEDHPSLSFFSLIHHDDHPDPIFRRLYLGPQLRYKPSAASTLSPTPVAIDRGSSPKNTKFSNGTYTQKNLSELLNVLT